MDEKILEDYIVINAAVNKQILNRISLSAGIKNLFDTDYALQFGNTLFDLDYPMPGRIFFIHFAYNHKF
jgi:outer membrane receptor protein involved in Fe transport